MSNVLTGNPLVLDTASTSSVVMTRTIFVEAIVWDQGASGANTDQAIIKDKFGNTKWSQTILTGNLVPASVSFPKPVPFEGIIMHTLGHGTVYVYYTEAANA